MNHLALVVPYFAIANTINRKLAPSVKHVSLFPAASAPPLSVSDISEVDEVCEDNLRTEFECPITLRTMRAPVICTLDGISYHGPALHQSLEKFRSTPSGINLAHHSIDEVMRLNSTLQNAINHYLAGDRKAEADCYICPLSGSVMHNAVFCTLDKLSYDVESIQRYLEQHGKTPSGCLLAEGKSAKDVLVPNIALRKAIENYELLANSSSARFGHS